MTKKCTKITRKTQKCTIISNKNIASDHFLLKIEAPFLAKNANPGQFVNVKVKDNVTDPLLRIPLGVHRVHSREIDLLYKVVGPGTELLSKRKKGEKLDVLGPLGNGFDLSSINDGRDKTAIIVAGGHGVAPLVALAEEMAGKKIKIEVFAGHSTKKHIVCVKEFKKLGAKVHIATDDGTQGHKGHVTGLLNKHIKSGDYDPGLATIYACGPRPMLSTLAKDVKRYKIPTQVSLDEYMACGIGACLGCAVRTRDGYKLICKDGPVFDAGEVEWGKVKG
ncbi:MAG: dihydroorotate dehydrogenase electron transfer subunit [Candidatus Omnitrophica bacterium]|nr:dihydroorotate dehydrogenase electron transfer subunit [Candidatus Omnitrophota bacterium]